MKLNVSVPDELWQSAREATKEESPSAIVQLVLRSWVERQHATSSYRRRPDLSDDLKMKQREATERIEQMLQAQYAGGYAAGIELATQLEPEQLVYLTGGGVVEAANFARDVEERRAMADNGMMRADPFLEGVEPIVSAKVLAPLLGSYAAFVMKYEWRPTTATVEGIDQALRDIYESAASS